MQKPVVKSPRAARVFMEGPEICREYFKTDKITFGSSQLQPGQTGAVDHGHSASKEVFFCSRGHVLINCGEAGFVELSEGDACLMPETVPHEMTNIGDAVALVTWALAPSE